MDIDGVERATLSFGQFRTDGPSGAAYMRIGDISGAWASSSRLEAFSFAVVPETHWSGLAAGAGLMGFVIWRGTRLGGIRVRQG